MPKTWLFFWLHSSCSCWGLHGLHWPSQRFFRSAQFPACWASGERGVHSFDVCRKCTTLPLFAHRCCSCFVHLLDHVLAGKCWTNSSGDQKQQYEYIVQQSSGLASCPAPAISRSEAFPAWTSEFVAGLRPSVLGGGVRTVLFVPCFIWFCMILPTSYVSVCRTCWEDSWATHNTENQLTLCSRLLSNLVLWCFLLLHESSRRGRWVTWSKSNSQDGLQSNFSSCGGRWCTKISSESRSTKFKKHTECVYNKGRV